MITNLDLTNESIKIMKLDLTIERSNSQSKIWWALKEKENRKRDKSHNNWREIRLYAWYQYLV